MDEMNKPANVRVYFYSYFSATATLLIFYVKNATQYIELKDDVFLTLLLKNNLHFQILVSTDIWSCWTDLLSPT